jgi:hypothetical protein
MQMYDRAFRFSLLNAFDVRYPALTAFFQRPVEWVRPFKMFGETFRPDVSFVDTCRHSEIRMKQLLKKADENRAELVPELQSQSTV